MRILENIAAVARPVRIVANSSLANSIARSIFSSASKSVSSITCSVASFRRLLKRGPIHLQIAGRRRSDRLRGGDKSADPLAADRPDDGVLTHRAEDEHRQLVVHTQAER